MTEAEIKEFILTEGKRAQRITETIKAHLKHLLETKGFRDVVFGREAFYSRWELAMKKGQSDANAADVERFLAEGLREIGYEIRSGLVVTAILDAQVKSTFYVLERGQPGFV